MSAIIYDQLPTVKTQEITGGLTNVIIAPAVAGKGYRLRSITGAFSVAAGAPVKLTVSDGATVIWSTYVPLAAGPWSVTIPADPAYIYQTGQELGGLFNTVGNTMTVTLAAPGGAVVSELNCEFIGYAVA